VADLDTMGAPAARQVGGQRQPEQADDMEWENKGAESTTYLAITGRHESLM
jgi:hypothetical protein